LQAIELFDAAGEHREAAALAVSARRFLALAGERALNLDPAQAEVRLVRALELTPADDPEREVVVARWAEAAYQAGRLGEAAEALDEVLDRLRASGRIEATARALQLRSRLAQRLGQAHRLTLAAEAVHLLEQRPPRQALVDAYAQLASSHQLNGQYPDAIAAADRACKLAQTLGLPEPARALGYRGYARRLSGTRTDSRRWSARCRCSWTRAWARMPGSCRTTSRSPGIHWRARRGLSPPSKRESDSASTADWSQ
jgi:tetratricopeptide (TPR) repeat protein